MPEILVLLKKSWPDGNISNVKSRYFSVLLLGLLKETESTGFL
jgi:hypothetical protein